jgi:hypothetical protein
MVTAQMQADLPAEIHPAILTPAEAIQQFHPGSTTPVYLPLTVAQVKVTEPARKSFAAKHPVLHRRWRRLRRICQAVNPVVEFAGNCAQVVTAARKY